MWNEINVCKTENFLNSSVTQDFSETILLSSLEVDTLATVTSTQKVFNKPALCCTSSPLYVIISLGSRVSIYKADCFEFIWDITLVSDATLLSLSDDSQYLLIAESNGLFNLFQIPTKKNLWSHVCSTVRVDSITIKNAFLSVDLSGFLRIHIFSEENIVFIFSNIEISGLDDGEEDNTCSEAFDDVHVEEIDLLHLYPDFKIVGAFQTFRSVYSAGLLAQKETFRDHILYPNSYSIAEIADNYYAADWEFCPQEQEFSVLLDVSFDGHILKAVCTQDGRYIVLLNDMVSTSLFEQLL
ncbi:uncharacterized protein LOC118201981 [Stegodyphus dumicola]|uniref:uncharacterized protein LOC118201981 n=1 Tax=Stegodyphus dumicola TaxID=202533 RepID=UPI0015A7772A|nr:uncharacterized protein LOC118201981 [Stegodyphus dumicola]XP_035230022.1 uncharacterized protein LOC118201981 [Stegodyphus dumicola]